MAVPSLVRLGEVKLIVKAKPVGRLSDAESLLEQAFGLTHPFSQMVAVRRKAELLSEVVP